MIMYHGTTIENFESIKRDKRLIGPVYITPKKCVAEEYAFANSGNVVIIELDVDESLFNVDAEFVNEWNIDKSLEAGSVYTKCDLPIKHASFEIYEDYELTHS